ncbi:hypothetical protein ACJIZ3_014889 [Penstemon smallii]|uniref:Remorin C-terminal domain-containing protein n=1 Tax=Penstemon smallii TaxID=265156 RepID=A0ABD3RP23_9LAMI
MRRNSGAYTSPGTPEYGDVGEIPITWSSERVPFPNNSRKRHITAAALIPLNGGRTLPSKWDDAERWITSPVSGYGAFKNSFPQPQRRPKSKSGPLAPGLGYLSNNSPIGNVLEGGNARNFTVNSPLTTGVLVPDGLSIHYNGGISAKSNSMYGDNNITRSTSVPGLSDLISETSVQSSQDDRLDGVVEEEDQIPRAVSRRDMATQMSPDESTHSSNQLEGLSFSTLSNSRPTSVRLHGNPASKDEIRDVQVDKGTTTTAKPSKKHGVRKTKDLTNVKDLPSAWNINEASKNTSKLQREEAKITAWENLQKAKAEAAIRKLEMKLEKKRSASMDKIMSKLRAAQMKAEAIRNTLSENDEHRSSKTSRRWISCFLSVKICSISKCFRCRKH